MDVNALIEQLTGTLGQAPELLQGFAADPAGIVEQVSGLSLGEADLAQVVEGVTSQLGAGGLDLAGLAEGFDLGALAEQASGFDLGALAEQASGLLGEDSPLGDIGGFLGGLFGK